jgi:hypothetical protein
VPRPLSALNEAQSTAVGDPGTPRTPARRCDKTYPSRPMTTSPLGANVGAAAGKLKVRTAPVLGLITVATDPETPERSWPPRPSAARPRSVSAVKLLAVLKVLTAPVTGLST